MSPSPTGSLAAIRTDADAFEAFYREYVDQVRGFVSRRVDDPATAADLTADVFLAVIERADTYDPSRGHPRMWLYGIARHVVADDARRSARRARAVSRVAGRRLLDGDAYQAVVDRLDAEAVARDLHRRIAALPRALREVIELVGLDGLEVAEAAVVLGIRPGTARVRLHRARRLLGEPDPPPGPHPAVVLPLTVPPTPRSTR